MAQGKKTDPKIKKSVLAAIAAGENITDAAKKFGATPSSAYTWNRRTKIESAADPKSTQAAITPKPAPAKKTAVDERSPLEAGHKETWGVIMRNITSLTDKTYPIQNDGFLRRSGISLEPKV